MTIPLFPRNGNNKRKESKAKLSWNCLVDKGERHLARDTTPSHTGEPWRAQTRNVNKHSSHHSCILALASLLRQPIILLSINTSCFVTNTPLPKGPPSPSPSPVHSRACTNFATLPPSHLPASLFQKTRLMPTECM